MKTWRIVTLTIAMLAALATIPTDLRAQELSTAQVLSEARVRELVLQTIRENPEIVLEAVAILEARQAKQQAQTQSDVLSSQRQILERDPNAPVLANIEGDVTVVEFFDYNCPYCKRVAPEVAALVESDPNVRLVYREWPILGEGSVYAARAALASRKQGKYEEFHKAMMGLRGRADESSVRRVAEKIGLDVDQLLVDMEAPEVQEHIDTSMRLASSLGMNGTPSFVIGDAIAPGYIDLSQLQGFVAQARAIQ